MKGKLLVLTRVLAMPAAAQIGRRPTRPQVDRPSGAVWQVIRANCTACHSRDRVDPSRYPEERWRVIAVDMRERGAKITDEELERLVEWLGRVWGTNQDK
jgi:mono/diheme cytochrome c family protein